MATKAIKKITKIYKTEFEEGGNQAKETVVFT